MKKQELRRISKFALWGAVGFGIGGTIGGIITLSLYVPNYFSYPILGFFGGASLGLALKDWKRVGLLALAGSIGFGVSFFATWFISEIGILVPPYVKALFRGAVLGGLGGACLGLVLKGWGRIGLLALAGAIGFGVVLPFISAWRLPEPPAVLGWNPQLSIWGITGGAMLGAALGYLEKRKVDRNE